ncbi:MAG: peptidase S41 [Polyangiaceae bacterium]|nr:peptidase S41 [Polyangiaceae bacterium]
MRRLVSLVALLGLGAVSGCSDDDVGTGGSGAGAGPGAGPGGGGGGGAPACQNEAVPQPPSSAVCERMPGGPAGARSNAVDLSATHDLVRFFSPVEGVDAADQALVAGLASEAALASGDLSDYASALPGVLCARAAASGALLGPASVEVTGGVAWIVPGTGAVTIGAEATAAVIDLRDLPDDPDLRTALEAAVAPALVNPIARPSHRVREHDGLVDEVFSPQNAYSQRVVTVEQPAIPASGSTELAIGLLTGPVMPPEAAELAIALRAAGRAFIIGEDVRADVAESQWQGVGSGGAYVRTRELRLGPAEVPDVITADRRSTAPECVAAEVMAAGSPQPFAGGQAERAGIEALETFGIIQPSGESLPEAQAALIVAHAAARRFFAYFAVVGDTIDARLDETLGDLEEPLDRAAFRNALRRFGEALHDGHNFVFNMGSSSVVGYMPVMLEDIDGEPVVRRSLAIGVEVGDTIVGFDGMPIADFYALELPRTSAASPGYQFNIASRELLSLAGPVMLDLRDPDGATRTITFQPQPGADYNALGSASSTRAAGYLDDLGAPSLYYVNIDGGILSSEADFAAAMVEAQGATGMVVDMRGYPGVNHYNVVRRLQLAAYSSPVFLVTRHTGPDAETVQGDSYDYTPQNPFAGPIVLLVAHHTVSAAENFSTMLVDAERVTVIGRNSAATNGNITGVNVPGAFAFTFTGMDVRHADARMSVFHGEGIRPDAETVLTAADFKGGVDPELQEAIAVLSN